MATARPPSTSLSARARVQECPSEWAPPPPQSPAHPLGASSGASCQPHGVSTQAPRVPILGPGWGDHRRAPLSPCPSAESLRPPLTLRARMGEAEAQSRGDCGPGPESRGLGQCLLGVGQNQGVPWTRLLGQSCWQSVLARVSPAAASCVPSARRGGRSLEEGSADSMRLRGWFREERVPGQEKSVFKAVLSAHRAGQARMAMPHVLRQQAQGCSRAVSCRLQTPEKPGPGGWGRLGRVLRCHVSAGTPWRPRPCSGSVPAARRPGPTRRW